MLSSYKKSTLVISKLARDFLTMNIGSQVPTITEYVNQFEVSRGVVQDALNTLQNENCVTLLKRGAKGSTLTEKDNDKLFDYSDWTVINGTMPTPMNPYLRSLATAIHETMQENNIPFCLSYVMGGERRSKLLHMGAHDFCIVSAETANNFVEQFPDLDIALRLYPCIYSSQYALFLNKANAKGIENGMKVCIDLACYDQTQLSYELCKGKKVEFVEHSAVTFQDLFTRGEVDALVTRLGNWFAPRADATVIPIETKTNDLSPVLLVNKNNYKLAEFLQSYLDPIKLYRIQQEVLDDPSKENFEV